ncbi:hypothetical protein ABLE91_09600 [Aquabacter sp. CN5-332]|uniref:hypothetical protein n=1 Tax=Aquabacter sp. CN5-332 TaxID=3156608 RepID=UPI0032B4672F
MKPVLSLLLASVVLTALPALKAAAEANEVAPGVFQIEYAKSGDWTVYRFAADKSGQKTLRCSAVKITGSELGLRFAIDPAAKAFTYGFMGRSSAVKQTLPVTFWFDNDRAAGTSVKAVLSKDFDGSEWLGIAGPSEPPGIDAPFKTAKKFSAAYQVDGRSYVESFPLAGSDAALKALFDCGRGQ